MTAPLRVYKRVALVMDNGDVSIQSEVTRIDADEHNIILHKADGSFKEIWLGDVRDTIVHSYVATH